MQTWSYSKNLASADSINQDLETAQRLKPKKKENV